ncbi:aminopeptidase N-like [Schistocerca serialis cubense]|uniref:aminopeptidase N-like n=1 Tax=Schistocerca serialis cubense TaxID=2023355 RepID=UPI00214E99A6|nr:aminopeptidase N-like [Schistocerca serialis cubense]
MASADLSSRGSAEHSRNGRFVAMTRLHAATSRRLCLASVVALVLVGVFGSADARAASPWSLERQSGATPSSSRAQEDYLLPTDTRPTAYAVTLSVHLGEEEGNQFAFQGNIRIDVSVEENTSTITLHNDGLEITTLTVKTSGDDVQHIDSTYENSGDDRQFLYIRLAEEVAAGTQLVVEISYEGELWNDMYGFYRSYYVEDGVTKWLGTTQFQPTYARRAFPCYDEPAIKAPFAFSFSVPSSYNVLFNTRLNSTMDDAAVGRKYLVFQPTPPMSSYLVAFVVSQFTEVADELGGVWARQQVLQDGQYAASVTKPIIDTMERLVNVPYETETIDKLDNVAIPDFSAGAMENWGLATYRERLILWADQVSDENDKQRIATVIAHELAHQWFGDLVSPRWWDVIWINEGFATFFEYFATQEVETDWKLDEQFVVTYVHTGLSSDSSSSSQALTAPAGSPSEVMARFNNIAYNKGGSVIRMMQHALGTDVFYDGLSRYLKANALSEGSDELLLAGLEEALADADPQPLLPDGKSFSEALRPWINTAGYPLVNVTRDYDTGTVTLTQTRFLQTEGAEPGLSSWDVPLTFTTGQEGDFSSTATRQWLPADAGEAQLSVTVASDDWLLVNIQEVGFYRVNYDTDNWALLAAQLQTDHSAIGVVNRAQILDDAFQLARAGLLDYSVALDNTAYLFAEQEYVPWYSALTAISYLDTRLQQSEEQQLLQTYLRTILADISAQLGYAETDDDSHVDRIHRELVSRWQCAAGAPGCLEFSSQELDKLIADENYL